MKKCTLCIDRIYNENLAPEDRQPACVMVCPVNARHFGDLGDPQSEVSEMVARRGGDGDGGANAAATELLKVSSEVACTVSSSRSSR